MRCYKCFPPSSTHFWHHFRKCVFIRINSCSEKESISRLIHAFNSPNVCGFVAYTLFFKCLLHKNHNPPPTLENWKQVSGVKLTSLYFGRWINACKCTFSKKIQNFLDEGGQHFQHLMLEGTWLFSLVILLSFRPPCSGGIAFDLPAGTWAISGCYCRSPCYGRHLSEMHCI